MWLDELKKMKESSGLTTKQIAAGAMLPEPTLEKIFSGATKDPKLTTIQQLVHFLGYTLDDLSPNQKAPAVEQEPAVTIDELASALVNLGFIDHRSNLSPDDLAFLSHIFGLLDGWFTRKRN